jgi:hypothetical protein
MSYTCGATTGDDISMVLANLGATAVQSLMMGWIKPTTLTAGRGIVGAGTIFGAEIGATTSELLLRTDNTTDGQWTTTGVGLAVNQWQFLALFNTCNNTGPAAAWRVWSGTSEAAPVACTVTQTVAPVGNFTGSTAVTLGNKGAAGVLAFQGQIGAWIFHRNATSGNGASMPLSIGGAVTAAEEEFLFHRYVMPVWRGEWIPFCLRNWATDNAQASVMYAPLDFALPIEQDLGSGLGAGFGTITLGGVTLSQERCPRPMALNMGIQPLQRMRR